MARGKAWHAGCRLEEEMMTRFNGRILMVGYGSVAQCTLPILLKLMRVPPRNITVMDFEDKAADLKKYTARGVHWVRAKVTRQNLGSLLGRHLRAGDLLIDLAWNIGASDILDWCHRRGVLYINTSVEVWDPYAGAERRHPTAKTLYWRQMDLRRMTARWREKGPTAVVEHGANPGLISHWTKRGLLDIAQRGLAERRYRGALAEEISHYAANRQFNLLAWKLGVKVIHCSERDTQISDHPKQVNEFVNTWSIEGFREEGTTTAEMGWGTHEKRLPAFAHHHRSGPRNQICLARMGMDVWVRSWVPDHSIVGMVVRHGEAFTISDRLTVWKNGRAVYRPTTHYAYCPCDNAIVSLHELRGRDYELQSKLRIMRDEITTGSDILGALIMGHAYSSWWTGSELSIEEARRLVPHQNATTLQVAISVVAAAMWMIENPAEGLLVPDDLPHDRILRIADPWLGRSLSLPSDWTPLKHYRNLFQGWNRPDLDKSDPWQFANFLIHDGK
jgi:homospermidine synthase